eukprot:9110315-Pyramimonas_sp.AAC.1
MATASPAEEDPREKVESTPAQPARVEPPPHPIAVRPIRKPGASQAQTPTGAPSQICHLCAEPSTEVRKGCSKRARRDHLDMGTK